MVTRYTVLLLLLGIKLLNDDRVLTGRMMTDNINDNN